MSRPVVIYGVGGHGRVIADLLLVAGVRNIAGVIDDNLNAPTRICGLPWLGNGDWLVRELERERFQVAVGVGDNFLRRTIALRCQSAGASLLTAAHPAAVVSPLSQIEAGVIIMAGAIVHTGARLCRGTVVNTGAVVEHDVTLGEFVQVASNAVIGGAAEIGALTLIALGAVVGNGRVVGSETVVGAGAVVVRDLPARVVAFGAPARIHHPLLPVSPSAPGA